MPCVFWWWVVGVLVLWVFCVCFLGGWVLDGFVWVGVVGYRCGFGWDWWFCMLVGFGFVLLDFVCLWFLLVVVVLVFVFGFCCCYVIVGFGFVGLGVMF